MALSEKKLHTILQKTGLSGNEAAVYLAMLSLGETTVLQIAKKSKVKRVTVYPILERLVEVGIASEVVRGAKRRFVAESPRKLERILTERKEAFHEALPDLLNLHAYPSQNQSVRVFEGIEGLKNGLLLALEDLMPGDTYCVVANIEGLLELFPKFFYSFAKKRADYNIELRTMLQDGPLTREYMGWAKGTREEIVILPKNASFMANIIVTPHRVVMPHIKPFTGAVVIENSQAVDTHQKLFEMLWGRYRG